MDGSGDIDGEELGAVAAELGMAMSAAEVRRRWRQHPTPPTAVAPPPPPPHGMIGTAPPPSASPPLPRARQVAAVMAEIDTDGGGDIDIQEFTAWFSGLDAAKPGERVSQVPALSHCGAAAGGRA